MTSRLWVTGAGLVTALGAGVEATWAGLVEGRRAIGEVKLFETSGQRVGRAAEVSNVAIPVGAPGAWSRTSAMALVAATEAMAMARLETKGSRVGLVVGGTTGGMLETESWLARLHADRSFRRPIAAMLSHPLTSTGDRLEERLGPFSRVRTLSSACSSGANALVVGALWLRSGEVDAVVAGGSDALCRLTLSGFNALGAVDPDACRPFHRRRRGMSLGEGAGFLVIERSVDAAARRVRPIAELAGWALGSEAHHITNPAPDGAVVAALIDRAIRRAGLSPGDVDYVNAHGTATAANDSMEAAALSRALGAEIDRVAISSSKGQIGHTLGAAGGIEAAITALVVDRKTLVPTAGLDDPDPALRLHHVPHVGRAVPRVRAALSNAFGFGGLSTVLVFTEPSPAGAGARGGGRASEDRATPSTAAITSVAVLGSHGLLGVDECADLPDGAAPPRFVAPPVDLDAHLDAHLDVARSRRLDRASRLAAVVVERALRDARAEREPAGVLLGSAFGNVDATAAFMHRVIEKGPRSASPAEFPNLVPSSPVGHVSIYAAMHGPTFATADLAASGESAFVQAVQMVAQNDAVRMVAGASELRDDVAERALGGLFAHDSSPIDAAREDLAAAMTIENMDEARRRGAVPLARVAHAVEWRGDGAVPPIAAPRGTRPEVIVARADRAIEEVVVRTAWRSCRRWACTEAFRESYALGAAALAVAAARVGRGRASDALVVGVARGRGYAVVLVAP